MLTDSNKENDMNKKLLILIPITIVLTAITVVLMLDYVSEDNDIIQPVVEPHVEDITPEQDINDIGQDLEQYYEPQQEIEDSYTPNIDTSVEIAVEDDWMEDLLKDMKQQFDYYEESFPVSIYVMSSSDVDNKHEVIVGCKNTDLVCIAYSDDYENWEYLDCTNYVGSDYPVVYWINGIPDNNEEWYSMLLNLDEWPGELVSDYDGGNECTFVNNVTGNEYTLTLQ